MTAPRIFDTHAHVFPQNVFDKIWAYFDVHHWPIYYRQPEAERAAFLDANTAHYTTLCYAHKPGMAAWLNDYVLQYAAAHPKAVPTGTFHPDDADVLAYVEAGLKRGLRGFKLHLEVQKFNPADPRLAKVYALLSEAGVVLTVHTSGYPLPGPWTGIEHFVNMLALAPRLPMIVAHMAGSDHELYWKLAADHPLYFDTAMVGVEYDGFGLLSEEQKANVRARADRFVFGSDFPSIPYAWSYQVDVVKSWGLTAEQERSVFHDTAAGLFSIRSS